MSSQKCLHNRKGVAPTTSAITMLAITVFAMIVVISFSQSIIAYRSAQMGERMIVENVLFTSIQVKLFVRNTGHGELILTEALINGKFYPLDDVILPAPEGNQYSNVKMIIIDGSFVPGIYRISLFSTRNNELGITEVEYA